MISIKRPTEIPKTLKIKGVQATKEDCTLYSKNKKKFLKDFNADPKLYGSKTVKKALKKAQHNKCCFCEKDQVDEYGAVEHYRPKKGYKVDKGQKTLSTPGYYWLAYDWSNLLFVCGLCNTSHKQNYFGLKDEKKRAKSHKFDIQKEEALLLDPSGIKDPRKHIYFKNQFPMHTDEFGQYTIEYCGLDRDSLNTARQKLISDIEARLAVLSKKQYFGKAEVNKAKEYIINCRKPNAEFSSMARDYLAQFTFKRSNA